MDGLCTFSAPSTAYRRETLFSSLTLLSITRVSWRPRSVVSDAPRWGELVSPMEAPPENNT